METIFYSTTDELRKILATRTEQNLPAAVIVPRGLAWLLPKQAGATQKLTKVG